MKTATKAIGKTANTRQIKITKRIAESIRSTPTEGWIHIMPFDGKWRVRKHGSVRASGIYEAKDTAIAAAKKLSPFSPNKYIFVHNVNGGIAQTIHE